MSVIDQLKKDIHESVLGKDAKTSESLKYLLSLIQKEESRKGKDLSEQEVASILAKEMKHKKEARQMFSEGERTDLAEKEAEEIVLLEKYLPDQASKEEIKNVVKEVVSSIESDNFGQIMGQVMARLKGKADGELVQKIVKEELSQVYDN